MIQPAHADRAHALLSASQAERWINCPPSARLTEHIPDRHSEYANQGTAAHEYAEMLLRRQLTVLKSEERKNLDKQIKTLKETNQDYDAEMETAITDYDEIVEERFLAAKRRSNDAIVPL